MKVELHRIKIRDIAEGFVDNEAEGVKGYGGRLDIRPRYQRNFVYDDKKRDAVVHSIRNDFPLSVMYWVRKPTGDENEPWRYEVLDGQQRTISFCQFVDVCYTITENGNARNFNNLPEAEKEAFLDYELMVYICEGTEEEELEWFQVINIAGDPLGRQELRNAVYSGDWVTSAKEFFSKPGNGAKAIADDYMSVRWNRQEGLERAIEWASDGSIEDYMSAHKDDKDAEELWKHFKSVINWVTRVFPAKYYRKEMKKVDWGYLYSKYSKDFQAKDADRLEKEVARLFAQTGTDGDITKPAAIYGYVLGEPEKTLSVRTFSPKQKRAAYELQEGKCPYCVENGNDQKYEFDEMEGDHIVPWSLGGSTTASNCQMLCKEHNSKKSDKVFGKGSAVAGAFGVDGECEGEGKGKEGCGEAPKPAEMADDASGIGLDTRVEVTPLS